MRKDGTGRTKAIVEKSLSVKGDSVLQTIEKRRRRQKRLGPEVR